MDLEGSVIARKYRLESLLGEGGMGTVWRAFHLHLEVPVAVKLLRADVNTADLQERLRVEGRAIAKLVHPAIVRVFDIGEAESGEPFIVMELLNGESLGTILERGALMPVSAVQLLLPIAEALVLAHSRGIVHRDLKPDNIVIASEGALVQPKLLDFGIAKMQSAMVTGVPTVTQSGVLLGSPEYMSPEQAYGRSDIDERSDVWAFCVVLYEALSGQTPFRGESCQEILRSVVRDEPVPLAAFAGVDSTLSALVESGLAKDRESRPASIFELGRRLAAWLYAQGVREDAAGSSLEVKWLVTRYLRARGVGSRLRAGHSRFGGARAAPRESARHFDGAVAPPCLALAGAWRARASGSHRGLGRMASAPSKRRARPAGSDLASQRRARSSNRSPVTVGRTRRGVGLGGDRRRAAGARGSRRILGS
jgi:eukaryotic-like serine/threonine-protein kinase